MTNLEKMEAAEEIHLSVADADDLEQVHEAQISVADVLQSLLHHPWQIISRWNWKSATIGALVRASFYFTVYSASRESWIVTLTAMAVEFSFRFVTSGAAGALVQSFRRATPPWLATVIVTFTLPTLSHLVEFFTHYIQESYFSEIFAASQNNSRQKAFAVSVLFSVISAMFNLFIMRHGVLLVGAGRETGSFLSDLRRIPYLMLEFMSYLPIEMIRFAREGRYHFVLGVFLAFGTSVGFILGVFRGRWTWAWRSALGAWVLLFLWTLLFMAGSRIYEKFIRGASESQEV
ncbi:MAG TPA: hypothetical protein DEA22_00085 [Blastocatellia bacterium]|nr:hypothetical protein [Blastocatellia bacterium]